jgi:hypothetical protein
MFSARHDLTCNGGGSVKQIFRVVRLMKGAMFRVLVVYVGW